MQVIQRHADTHPGSVRTSLAAALDAGIARAELAFPAALAPHAPFEIEAPRAALLYSSPQLGRALSPVRCDQVSCTYELGQHAEPSERQIIAQLTRAGRYDFEVLQRTGYGEVRGRVALHVRP